MIYIYILLYHYIDLLGPLGALGCFGAIYLAVSQFSLKLGQQISKC